MTFTTQKVKIKTIKQDDPMFYIRGDIVVSCRAGFEFSVSCPREYRLILSECIDKGWLKPVAYMRDDEYTWESLKA